jgi:hypothetical protein
MPEHTDATTAVINPYALAEVILGRRIDWSTVPDQRALLENVLQFPYDELFDPVYGGPLYTGLELVDGRLEKVRSPLLDIEPDREGTDADRPVDRGPLPINVIGDLRKHLRTDDVAGLAVRDAVADRQGRLVLTLDRPRSERLARLARVFTSDIVTSISIDPSILAAVPFTPPGGHWEDVGRFFDESAEFFDPVQGAVANCYFIAALSAVAWATPYRIQDLVRSTSYANQAFTHLVRFHKPDSGGLVDQEIEVTESLVVGAGNNPFYARSSEAGEIWPGVYEKAFAKLVTGHSGDQPNILATGWGDCVLATAQLTGGHREYVQNPDLSAHDIWQKVRKHSLGGRTVHPMTAWTYSTATSAPLELKYADANIVGSHCYTILGWDYIDGTEYLLIRNPWGMTEASKHTFTGSTVVHDISWWRSINLAPNDGTFALTAAGFKDYFAGFGVVV